MPQDRRKVAFSAKQKKLQLQQKRAKKHGGSHSNDGGGDESQHISETTTRSTLKELDVLNKQPSGSSKHDANRYKLVFKKESGDVVKERLLQAYKAFEVLPEEKLEVSYEDVFAPGTELDIPKRPSWDHRMTKEALEAQEEKYFMEYISALESRYEDKLSHFELNLETWRQLWRVLEFSDIILLVTDIRFAVFHFSPALYDYVVKEMKKDMIVVFNKIDLVPAHIVTAWKEYFQQHFPKLKFMYFASYAGMRVKEGSKGRRIGKLYMAVNGARYLLKLCEEIVDGQVDLSSWHDKIEEEAAEQSNSADFPSDGDNDDDDDDDDHEYGRKKKKASRNEDSQKQPETDTSYYQEARYKDGVLTIGFVGHPNVGKSSFLNAVFGKKIVSVSRTPGHTKHYQTILLTPTVRLCDCPGLVFPSLVPKSLQVLMGCYPIAQLREPYSSVSFLCQRVPVQSILKLQHPEYDPKNPHEKLEWSAFDVCEAWAKKRGFYTARSARSDAYRAANNILRMALDGRTICLCFYPPNFVENKEFWMNHPDVQKVKIIQASKTEIENASQASKIQDAHLDHSEEDHSSASDENSSGESSERGSSAANKFSVLAELS